MEEVVAKQTVCHNTWLKYKSAEDKHTLDIVVKHPTFKFTFVYNYFNFGYRILLILCFVFLYLHKHTTYFNTPRLKNTIFKNGRYTTNIPTDPHTITTTDIKTNMRHMYINVIVSMHLDTRGNYKILRTPPPHISSSGEILSRLTRRTLAQPRTKNHPSSVKRLKMELP